ncbi:hypothetical protein E5CHR_02086 [Variovorax sp. PBL-E5]|nr:hypothetical protein E5CHR_02086 [Variovorax sp. PBL-E5]
MRWTGRGKAPCRPCWRSLNPTPPTALRAPSHPPCLRASQSARTDRVAVRRVVFDTNVVLSALLFGGKATRALRDIWQQGGCAPLVSTATAAELVRVLAYRKFRLSPAEREAARRRPALHAGREAARSAAGRAGLPRSLRSAIPAAGRRGQGGAGHRRSRSARAGRRYNIPHRRHRGVHRATMTRPAQPGPFGKHRGSGFAGPPVLPPARGYRAARSGRGWGVNRFQRGAACRPRGASR